MAESDESTQDDYEDLRKIPKWTRKYAESRSVDILVMDVIMYATMFAVALWFSFVGTAYKSGNMVWFFALISALAIAIGALVFIHRSSRPGWLDRLFKPVDTAVACYYSKDGSVVLTPKAKSATPEMQRRKRRLIWAAATVWIAICASGLASLRLMGYTIPAGYFQPSAALIGVPILVILAFRHEGDVRLHHVLASFLFGLHAVLVVLGIMPRSSENSWISLHIILPLCICSILAALIRHGYNRLALRKLKRLARIGTDGRVEGGEARA